MARGDKKTQKLKARVPRGFQDREADDLRVQTAMLARICEVFELYGFEPVETPQIEYTDALGKFLPDQDRPNEGVFSFQDDDEQWLSLRYDLTAPLARYVAQNFETLPKPYRSYRFGTVYRNEKPGPGRFRQFLQFDADTVGAPPPVADAEMCMMMADTLEAVGIPRGDYVIRVNNRKVLDGVMEAIGLSGDENAGKRLQVMRAIDKLDRVGINGVRQLLGSEGRTDESGDHMPGVGLGEPAIERLALLLSRNESSALENLHMMWGAVAGTENGAEGVQILDEIRELISAAGYNDGRVQIDPSVVRGLEYYTGPVYEAELTFETVNEKGEKARYGSVAGGGRYDGLVARFGGQQVPATGFSIGVSRLQAALTALGKVDAGKTAGPVVVTVMDRDQIPVYQRLVTELRTAGIRSELFVGNPKQFGKQMQYADRRGSPCVIIQGADERENGTVQIKDLIEGAKIAASIDSREDYQALRPAQEEVPVGEMVAKVGEILAAHGLEPGENGA
ncbi:MAG: histidine--tRNA ligase [Pseudomonadota bacterium]